VVSTPELRNFLLIGFRGSGKTTFLAAVWHLLEAQELASALFAPTLQPDREHLNSIRRRWLRLEPTTRTTLGDMQTVAVTVQDRESGTRATMTIPDFSGEVFRMQWEEREALHDYVKLAQISSGAVLFVHPHRVKPAPRIQPTNGTAGKEDNPDTAPWKPEHAPTQVQLVDILQTYLRLAENRPTRLAVVVSAWDLILDNNITPDAWFSVRLPLLAQFFTARAENLAVKYFGVSAQGGDLPDDIAKLQKAPKPSERIYVVEDDKRHADLTTVLRWIMAS
jgi:hypothetical protein